MTMLLPWSYPSEKLNALPLNVLAVKINARLFPSMKVLLASSSTMEVKRISFV